MPATVILYSGCQAIPVDFCCVKGDRYRETRLYSHLTSPAILFCAFQHRSQHTFVVGNDLQKTEKARRGAPLSGEERAAVWGSVAHPSTSYCKPNLGTHSPRRVIGTFQRSMGEFYSVWSVNSYGWHTDQATCSSTGQGHKYTSQTVLWSVGLHGHET